MKSEFKLTNDYLRNNGVDVMAFDDFYPEGHQSGISIIMHGNRVATNGDIRFEQTPGQWQPVPKQLNRKVDEETNTITTELCFPDKNRHLKGFNPMIYPDFEFNYKVSAKGYDTYVAVKVDLDRPIPEKYSGKLCFNLELFPGALFEKPWIMDNKSGIFPRQPNSPVIEKPKNLSNTGKYEEGRGDTVKTELKLLAENSQYNPIVADDLIAEPYAVGRRFTSRPDDELNRFTIESKTADLKLYDGRMNHNNGWFVLSSEIPTGKTEGAIEWIIRPNVVESFIYGPIIQTSQVGYHPNQPKVAVIELDRRYSADKKAELYRIGENGAELVKESGGEKWGAFLRYDYLRFDFTDITEEGLYQVKYGDSSSSIFRIASDVYNRGVWQPVLEYFLPMQMCHMRVNEKYRVWHGLCHNDDALMAPVNLNHIDGYAQGPSTLCKYKPGEHVPGINVGGWHDAGDFDLRIESQSGEVYILSEAFEEFGVDLDVTSVDQVNKVTEIHQPDGKNDILQQIEHGVLSIVGGYNSLGRLYRGIICNSLRQYVLLGDGAAMTDGIAGNADDRWVFTEDNPPRELSTASHLAAASRALKGYNDELSARSLEIAEELYKVTKADGRAMGAKVQAAAELLLTTGKAEYKDFLISNADFIAERIEHLGWVIAKSVKAVDDADYTEKITEAMKKLKLMLEDQSKETPYGIPYRPHIWGAGWNIQSLGFHYYFLYKAFPEIFDKNMIFDALNFILGSHPGSNTASFASGVGAKSAIVAYGANRADWTYIPGGVVSGTALIRPDFPELLEFPFLWQQTEYVLGGGSSHYMFLVLAVQRLLGER